MLISMSPLCKDDVLALCQPRFDSNQGYHKIDGFCIVNQILVIWKMVKKAVFGLKLTDLKSG